MTKVIGVRFRTAGKIYFFAPGKLNIQTGDKVIVETARGVEFGTVVTGEKEVEDDKIMQPLKPVIRIATAEDKKKDAKNRDKEKEAFGICLEKIRKHGLEMKLIDAEYTFDNNKVLFYFTADGRIGICGRPLCCHTYLSEFAPVSIKMAKEQNLSLNPTKISGVCGRLMCCLTNEEETYEELNSHLPSNGDHVTTPEGLRGDVQSVNVLRQLVKVVVTLDNDEKEIREYKATELKFKPRRRKKEQKLSKEEMAELKALEGKRGDSKLDDN